jgi:hypothetical protein
VEVEQTRTHTIYHLAINRKPARLGVSRFTQAAGGMRYDAPHQAGHTAMLRNFSENSFSDRASNYETRGPDVSVCARSPAAESQMLMERKMSLQTLPRTNDRRFSLAGSALLTLFRQVTGGLLAFGTLFMKALCESRQRQANQVIRQYRHLIDRSDD